MKRLISIIVAAMTVNLSAIANESTSDSSTTVSVTTTPAATATQNAGQVARATFTSAIEDREPVDGISTLSNDNEKIYFFTELKDMAGQAVAHRWEHNGEVMAEVPFEIGANRWRIYSSKNLDPSWTGEWVVSVIDGQGGTISSKSFTYNATAAENQTAPAAEATPTSTINLPTTDSQ